jgi:hypothetical protein
VEIACSLICASACVWDVRSRVYVANVRLRVGVHVNVRTRVCISCPHGCISMRVNACMFLHVSVCAYVCVRARACVCVCVFARVCVCVSIYVYTGSSINKYKHAHSQTSI